MTFLDVYVIFIRIVLVAATVYHIDKHSFKVIISTATVFILTFLIDFLDKVFDIKVDWLGSSLYFTVIFMAIYLGSALKFYDRYAWWDMLIHFLSGIFFVSFGIALSSGIEYLNKFNILFFSLTFSITLHVVWEVLEYIVDCIMHTDHQRWQRIHRSNNHKSETAIQPAGLVDTMNDTLICGVSVIVVCLIWWFIL